MALMTFPFLVTLCQAAQRKGKVITMKQILDTMLDSLAQGESVVLCSIFASSGSSPRGAGAKMAVFADGHTMGTIGGGAVEYLAAQRALECMQTNEPLLRSYDLRPDEVESIGMICGGKVTVYFQLFTPQSSAEIAVLRRWRELLDGNENAWLSLALDGARAESFEVLTAENIPSDRRDYFTSKAVWKNGVYVEPVFRAGKVYIFGGGHVGKALVPVLSTIGFPVVMFDNREALAKPENYPQASEVIFGDFACIYDKVTITKNDYVVIMTPGHHADFEILSQVLRSEATYIGCIGSKHKVAKTRELLLAQGYTDTDFARIHSPIGLPILAETPEEIAISIAAEMIEHRAKQ